MGAVLRSLAGMTSILLRGAGMILRRGGVSLGLPQEGSKAPLFSAKDSGGTAITLAKYTGRSHVVLFFFPKADTPG